MLRDALPHVLVLGPSGVANVVSLVGTRVRGQPALQAREVEGDGTGALKRGRAGGSAQVGACGVAQR
jgi:hypothetical protein